MSYRLDSQYPLPTSMKDRNLFDHLGVWHGTSATAAQLIEWTIIELTSNALQWETTKPGGVSTSRATEDAIQLDDMIRAIPLPIGTDLWGTDENKRSVLERVFDFRALERAITNRYGQSEEDAAQAQDSLVEMWRRLIQPMGIKRLELTDTGYEEVYRPLVRPVYHRLQLVATFIILSFWLEHFQTIGEVSPDLCEEYRKAVVYFGQITIEEEVVDKINRKTRPDLASWGRVLDTKPRPRPKECISQRSWLEMDSAVDLKANNIAGYSWTCRDGGGVQTKDQFLSKMLDKGTGDAKYTLKKAYDDAGKQPNSWRTATLHLVAQMHDQASKTTSGMVLFTSLYNFTRIGVLHPTDRTCFYLSSNIMEGLKYDNDHPVPGKDHSRRFVESFLFFVVQSTAASYPSYVPRMETPPSCLYILRDAVSQPPVSRSLDKEIPPQSLLEIASRWGGLQFWGALSEFQVSFGGGSFKRCDGGRGLFSIGRISFELGEDNFGRRASINRRAKVVLKTFLDERGFFAEYDIYKRLHDSRIGCVPCLYGVFWNGWMNAHALLISYVGEPIEGGPFSISDWDHLNYIITELHNANIHHHDLEFRNIVRRSDGVLCVIDFGSSIINPDCTPEVCPDRRWLEDHKPTNIVDNSTPSCLSHVTVASGVTFCLIMICPLAFLMFAKFLHS